MTIAELIEELKALDPDLEVMDCDDGIYEQVSRLSGIGYVGEVRQWYHEPGGWRDFPPVELDAVQPDKPFRKANVSVKEGTQTRIVKAFIVER